MYKMINALTFPPNHITYDASKDIARAIIKVMNQWRVLMLLKMLQFSGTSLMSCRDLLLLMNNKIFS